MSATPKQKAFIEYLGLSAPDTFEAANDVINRALKAAEHTDRAEQWKTDRFRLHPKLYAKELQMKKDVEELARNELPKTRVEVLYRTINDDYSSGFLAPFRRMTKREVKEICEALDAERPGWDDQILSGFSATQILLFDTFLPATERLLPSKVKQWKMNKDGYAVSARKSKMPNDPLNSGRSRSDHVRWFAKALGWLFKSR